MDPVTNNDGAGNPDELNKLQAYGKLPLEVVATLDGESVTFVALKDGKPVPKAEFVTVDEKLTNVTLNQTIDDKLFARPTQ